MILVDAEGNYYGFDAVALEARDPTEDELAAARIPDTSREAVQAALTYEHAGGFGDVASGAEVRVAGQVLYIVGRIALG